MLDIFLRIYFNEFKLSIITRITVINIYKVSTIVQLISMLIFINRLLTKSEKK